MSTTDLTLASAAQEWQQQRITGVAFVAVLLRSTVYCRSSETPGFVAWGAPGDGLIGVFSDLAELALACGAVPWLSTTGADLLSMWPDGYAIGLDVAADHALRLDHRWVKGLAALMPV